MEGVRRRGGNTAQLDLLIGTAISSTLPSSASPPSSASGAADTTSPPRSGDTREIARLKTQAYRAISTPTTAFVLLMSITLIFYYSYSGRGLQRELDATTTIMRVAHTITSAAHLIIPVVMLVTGALRVNAAWWRIALSLATFVVIGLDLFYFLRLSIYYITCNTQSAGVYNLCNDAYYCCAYTGGEVAGCPIGASCDPGFPSSYDELAANVHFRYYYFTFVALLIFLIGLMLAFFSDNQTSGSAAKRLRKLQMGGGATMHDIEEDDRAGEEEEDALVDGGDDGAADIEEAARAAIAEAEGVQAREEEEEEERKKEVEEKERRKEEEEWKREKEEREKKKKREEDEKKKKKRDSVVVESYDQPLP